MGGPHELMPTGIPELDQLLEGGIPRGNSLLIEGPPGSGKSTLGMRILYEGAVRYNEPGVLVSFEEFPSQLYAEALNWAMDLHALEDAGKLRVIWTPPSRILESFRGKSDLIDQVIKTIGARRLLIDSITHFKRISSSEADLREILSTVLTVLKIAGVNAVLVKELERQNEEAIAFEEYLVDASLRLHNQNVETQGGNIRYIEIRKTRGHDHISGLHPFQLEGSGLRIFPRLRPKDLRGLLPLSTSAPRQRLAFGVEELDEMLCGGLLPGSAAVVSGYAGCGKSVLSSHFLDKGLKTGARGILLSLKSDAEALLAAAETLGMNWRPAIESGQLRVLDSDPLGTCAEKVVDRLILEVRRSKPARFVCDSVDDLVQIARNDIHLREHLMLITDILRMAGATSLFLIEARQMGGEYDNKLLWFSHKAACSIKFSMAETEGELRRFIAIVKHAGSDHAKELREIRIDGRGLHVHRTAARLSGILTGQARRALTHLSNNILPSLHSVDRTLHRIAASDGASDALLSGITEARQKVGLISAQLREYFGGFDLAEDAAVPLSRHPLHGKILLAEDNMTNQDVARGILKQLGLSADAVANGAEAVKALETVPYDLVLMDVKMPVMDGFEATRQIRKTQSAIPDRQIPIIAMTAHAMQGDRERCLEAGMNDYVSKPLSARALVEVLEKWLPKEGAAPSPRTPHSSPTVWDPAVMLERVLGDEDLARRILERFREDIPRQIQVLKDFLEAGDASSVERQAHTIKGVAANVGGEALRAVAFEMEKASRAGDLNAAKGRMAELESQFERLRQAITRQP